MAQINFNTTPGQTVSRDLMGLYLNVAESSTPEWRRIGQRVEDSSMEMDWSPETKTDIWGVNWATLKKPVVTQSFDPCELDANDPAQIMLWNLAVKDQNHAALANLDLLVVHLYAGNVDTPFAERYPASTINPSSIGGAGGGSIGMPIEVTYGGKRATGTASVGEGGAITFTEA